MLQWADVLKDKSLQNLPYKIELDAKGRIIMTPASNRHGMFQTELASRLRELMRRGRVFNECSIATLDGVKVADVVWASPAFLKKYHDTTPYAVAPEICVEVASPSNSRQEIAEKIAMYLSKGAREVWVCDLKGTITFHDYSGKLRKSKLTPRFPMRISISSL
jgi:Uma2 family endonuclease